MAKLPKYFYFRLRPTRKGTAVEIEDASDVDVVEVVRCKDCEYYTALDDNGGRCNLHKITSYVNCFCSWAERRQDETACNNY